MRWRFLVAGVVSLGLVECGGAPSGGGSNAPESVKPVQATTPPAAGAIQEKTKADTRSLLICFGDSLTAGYGVPRGDDFPSLLQMEFDAKGLDWHVINAGQSGDTTSGGLDRLPQIVALKPRVVLLELGANDGLRGIPIAVTRANLEQMILDLQKAGSTVVLAGMTLPVNYGAEFIAKFEALYKDLARQHNLKLLRFELEPLAKRGLLQPDGMHPTAEGYRVALPTIYDGLRAALGTTR